MVVRKRLGIRKDQRRGIEKNQNFVLSWESSLLHRVRNGGNWHLKMTLVEFLRRSGGSTLGVNIEEADRHAVVEEWLNVDEEECCD